MAGKCIQMTAMLLSIMAAISLGVGVANVIAVYFFLYKDSPCQPSITDTASCVHRNVITLAFIGSGIWGSLVVFAVGILAIKSVANQFAYRTMFLTATFVSAVIIIPTMIILNTVNAVMVTTENSPSQLFNITNPSSNSVSAQVLLALPAGVGGLGCLEWILMAGLLVYTCMYIKKVQQSPSKEPVEAESQKPRQMLPDPGPGMPPPSAGPERFYGGPGLAYSPYGGLPYRRPTAYGPGADYGRLDAAPMYRPAVRAPYMYPAAAGRLPMPRPGPYPMSYVPPGY